jgi:hypothetical protein
LTNVDTNVRPLIFIPSPRDISVFTESVKLLIYDKYWVKYYPEPTAYQLARKFFLQGNYSHLIILPDDLIVRQSQIDMLIEDIKQNNYPVISGITNVDARQSTIGKYCISKRLPAVERLTEDSYDWFTEFERDQYLNVYKKPIVQVKHIGFPLAFVRRDVVKRLEFRPLTQYNCCLDVQFCYDCRNTGIPIYVDLRVVGKHLKKRDGVYENFGLGTKNPVTRFEKGIN